MAAAGLLDGPRLRKADGCAAFSFANAASAGRQLLLAALSPSMLERVPGCKMKRLSETSAGLAEYPLPTSADSWSECFRDLARTLQGGSTFIIGRQRLYPVRPTSGAQGDVSPVACNAAFETLCQAMRDELVAQGLGLSVSGELWSSSASESQVDGQAMRTLARQVAVHICIGPGMQTVMQNKLPPALWQPLFAVCMGCGQVRVMTFAFVGQPVIGDRPDRKRTPRVLRLATADLVAASQLAIARKFDPATASVHHLVEPADEHAQFILDHIVSLEDELFYALHSGYWNGLLGKAQPTQESQPSSVLQGCKHHLLSAQRAWHTGFQDGTSGQGGL